MEKTMTQNAAAAENGAENKKKNRNPFSILSWADVCLLTAVQALTVIFFLCGMPSVFGERISLIRCFYIFGNIFEYNSAVAYKLIVSILLAILYIVLAAIMIVNIIKTIKMICLFKNNMRNDTLVCIKENSSFIYILSFIYIVVSNAFYTNNFNSMTIFVICITGAALAFHEAVCCLIKTSRPPLSETVLKCVKFLICFFSVSVIFLVVKQAVFSALINEGFKLLFKGIIFADAYVLMINLYNYFVLTVIHTICIIWVLEAVDLNLSGYFVNRNDARSKVKKAWILSVVILALQFVFNGLILNKFREISLNIVTTWWYSVKNVYFPLFLLLTAWFLVLKFTPKEISDI